jgi:hypothetical protein
MVWDAEATWMMADHQSGSRKGELEQHAKGSPLRVVMVGLLDDEVRAGDVVAETFQLRKLSLDMAVQRL